ncbi:MAG TPA: hypothetical protein VG889_12035 [Rhizomicrobium sp.]|nr:hypothetical protein [Rhizomicrobium sp.]
MIKRTTPPDPPPGPITPADTARYTADLLDSLRKMAIKQEQVLLAHFLELAAVEARAQAGRQDQETRLPE